MLDAAQTLKGYRTLTQQEIDLINAVKKHAEEIGALCETLTQVPGIDQRWLAIGKTGLQQGFMAVTRAVAQPTTF